MFEIFMGCLCNMGITDPAQDSLIRKQSQRTVHIVLLKAMLSQRKNIKQNQQRDMGQKSRENKVVTTHVKYYLPRTHIRDSVPKGFTGDWSLSQHLPKFQSLRRNTAVQHQVLPLFS